MLSWLFCCKFLGYMEHVVIPNYWPIVDNHSVLVFYRFIMNKEEARTANFFTESNRLRSHICYNRMTQFKKHVLCFMTIRKFVKIL